MKDTTFKLLGAHTKVKMLLVLKGDAKPVAVTLGNALGWKWPEGMNQYESMGLSRLCDLLQVNLPGRPSAVTTAK